MLLHRRYRRQKKYRSHAQVFYDRHVRVVEHLQVISRHTRKVGMLDDDELDQLQKACAGFGAAFRKAYPKRGGLLTPKGHIVEKHVHYFARKYGTLGVFGEDGLESLHPLDARARVLVRTMPNPKNRHKAKTAHLTRMQLFSRIATKKSK